MSTPAESRCPTCGRVYEYERPTHHLGCTMAMSSAMRAAFSPNDPEVEAYCATGCGKRTKPYHGRGARPQYCEDHDTRDKRGEIQVRPKRDRTRKKEVSDG